MAPLLHCPSCGIEAQPGNRFCPACGFAITSPTALTTGSAAPGLAPAIARRISSDSIPVGGFTPGAILAGRYRVIGLLGRGGMGEVYRADDLKLGQPVALKFLPRVLAEDPVRRERFFAEVRITRQLAHPNICRVYDIAEFEGQHFLSMEYIDGEDLASLIQRIGHLSNEKALDIARQLVAGLAAAHDRGVLHRDLKPANIMLDGRGRVRITDFGLAVASGEEAESAEMYGTPAYMAPEQFAGKGASVRSDIYALGLILYEIYCGRKVFTAATLAELREQKETLTPSAPSEIRQGIDPIVERVIVRCLDRDPRGRPASAAQLAATLPGGDPLAAALAAGETPSPEMVAAAGGREGMRPALAWAMLALVALGTIAAVLLGERTNLLLRVNPPKPPDALEELARGYIRSAGYAEQPADTARGFLAPGGTLPENIDRSLSLFFWYRQSPRPIQRVPAPLFLFNPITPASPPLNYSREILIALDTAGRLRTLRVVPPQRAPPSKSGQKPDWSALFTAAGLDVAAWSPAEPQWNPDFFADTQVAWTGSVPEAPGVPVRIEAAAYDGKPVSFVVVYPWFTDGRMASAGSVGLQSGVGLATLFLVVGAAALLARRNLRLGRGDRRGAARLTVFAIGLTVLMWLLQEHHVATAWEILLILVQAGFALLMGSVVWLVYVAFEPFIRRLWPHVLISWNRLLAGEWRDPVLGRDVLAGCAAGVAMAFLQHLSTFLRGSIATPLADALSGTGSLLSQVAVLSLLVGTLFTFLSVLLLVFLRIVLRRDWLAVLAYLAVRTAPALGGESVLLPVFALTREAIFVFILLRFGVAGGMAMGCVLGFLQLYPITFDTSAWYAGGGYFALALVAAVALYGFRTALGSRRILDLPDS
jgi:serine/threonine-protein kinase